MEAAAAVSLPVWLEGGGGGSNCCSLIRKIHAMHWQSWDGTAAIVQKLWGNSARNLLLGCFLFPLCLLVQDAVSNNPFSLCCEIMQMLDSLHQGDRVTYIPSTCEHHLSPWSQVRWGAFLQISHSWRTKHLPWRRRAVPGGKGSCVQHCLDSVSF